MFAQLYCYDPDLATIVRAVQHAALLDILYLQMK